MTDWQSEHERALREGRGWYADPQTGYTVFTELHHLQRGSCCGAGCRHCPFAREVVQAEAGAPEPRFWEPALLAGHAPAGQPLDVVFWSGGKDSWLAWRALRKRGRRSVWLT